MLFADASRVEPGTVIDADVCVVGAGPAGLAVALELSGAGLRVALLESGGRSIEPATAALNQLEGAGLALDTGGPLRDRRLGGTAWYGRCVVLDPIDFETRAWVPRSGWPVPRPEVESRYRRAARFLGLPRPDALVADAWRGEPAFRALNGGGISARVHLFSHARDLGRCHRRAVERSPRIAALLHATVTGIDVDPDAHTVARVRVHGPDAREFSCRARRYVLACGGVENARLLLLLAADHAGVLGPACASLGRGYMDHARCEGVARLSLDPAHRAHRAVFRRLIEGPAFRSRGRVQLAAALDEETQRRERLLNAAAFFYAASAPRLAELRTHVERLWQSATDLRIDRSSLRRVSRDLPLLLGAGLARLTRTPFLLDHLVMVEQLEQSPDCESRVTLSDRRDRFGRRLARLEWRVGGDTLRTQRRFHQLLATRLETQRIGRLRSALLDDPDREPQYGDSAHPMGATRMSLDPRHGVVDPDCRVHGIENLHVAGSSVFPTGGHANPTLTLVALALRLADHLRERLGREA